MDPEDDAPVQDEDEARPPAVVHLCEGEVRAVIKYIDDPYERADALSILQSAGWAGAGELIEELVTTVFHSDLKIEVMLGVADALGIHRDPRFIQAVLSRVRSEGRYDVLDGEVLFTADVLEQDHGLLMHLLEGCLAAAVVEAMPPNRRGTAFSQMGAWLREVAPLVLPDLLTRMDWFVTRFCAPLRDFDQAENMWAVSEVVFEWVQSATGPEERRRLFELLERSEDVWMPVIGDDWMTSEFELMRDEFRPDEGDDSEE